MEAEDLDIENDIDDDRETAYAQIIIFNNGSADKARLA